MVSINGTDMTWYGSCHLVCIDARVWKGKKMRNLRGIKERNWSPTKIAHYIYHTDIKSNFTQLRPTATVNTTWTILPSICCLILSRTYPHRITFSCYLIIYTES